MRYGQLTRDEDALEIKRVVEEFGGEMPAHPYRVLTVIDDTGDGKLAAFLLIQTAIHAEPLWVRPDVRGKVDLTRLRDMVDDIIGKQPGREYYVFAPSDRIERLATYLGMEATPYRVIKRKF